MSLRDQVEAVLRSWDGYERGRGAAAIIDFDCCPAESDVQPASGRMTILRRLIELAEDADDVLRARIDSHITYLRGLLGERLPLAEYIRRTLDCEATGWPGDYVTQIGDKARQRLDDVGIGWSPSTLRDLAAAEGTIDADAAPDAIRQAVAEAEPLVRRIVDSDAPYSLNIEPTNLPAYWAYWLDGRGRNIRLRLNLRDASFTKVTVRQFALHEVLGHGLKGASYADRVAREDVPWVRVLSVHASHQVLLEGLAQTLPLFITPDDEAVITRVALEHYAYLVRAELHLAINAGVSVLDCVHHARTRVPWWTDDAVADALTDRSTDPLLRSYLWAYPAGQDWFTQLAATDPEIWQNILRQAYQTPLTTSELTELWPKGPAIGTGPPGARWGT